MKRRLKEPFGKAGLTVAVVAIVMALVGGAYAAGGLTKSQEKQVTKIAKKYAGKPGAPGPPGTNGTNGANGSPGVPGKNGESVTLAAAGSCAEGGTKVTIGAESKEICNGAKGTNGTSVTNNPITANQTNAHCKEGGTEFKVGAGTPTYACTGEPWTAGGTLPTGQTLKGVWSLIGVAPKGFEEEGGSVEEATLVASVSFGIPLSATPTVNYIPVGGNLPSGCSGTAANPHAASGNLCVFAQQEVNDATAAPLPMICPVGSCTGFVTGAEPFGFGLATLAKVKGEVGNAGTWAVTG